VYVGDSAAPGAGDDPLRFWQARGSRCPLLAPVARLVLAIPATSVPSERLFSTAGLVVDRLHASMVPDMVQKILFLNKFVKKQNRLHHA